jgi:hypothetical protein
MQRFKKSVRVGAAVLLAGCVADSSTPLAPEGGPSQVISDAAHAGAVPGFYFLPPMVPQPAYSGTFDAGVQPRVEVCELSGSSCGATIAQWTMTSGVTVSASAEQYQVNWHTSQFDLDPAKHYRISVFVGAFRLGYADVDVVASGKDLKNVDTQQFVALLDGRTLPIKFRIETGIVAAVVVSPDSADIAIGGTQQFTATLIDLHGNPMTGPTVAWASSDEDVATIDPTGLATGVAPGAATITATAQAASGTAILTVFNPNQPPVAEPDTFSAIGNFTVPVSAPGVLANDTDPDANPLQAVAGTFPTANGGTFTLNADGSFTYLSAAGFTGEDEVGYEITDGLATASSMVTFVVPTRVWYVANDGTAPGDGRDASPFTELKLAEAASLAGETIFVLAGDGSSNGLDEGIVLKDAQSLTGQGVPANVTASLNGETVVLLAAGSAPQLTRGDAGATVALAQDNTVQGMDVASTAGAGIAGAGFGTLTAGSVSVSAAGGPSLDLSSGTAAAAFAELSSAGSAGAGLRLVNVGGLLSAPTGSIVGAAGTGIEVSGGNAAVTYGGNVASVGPRPVSVAGRTGGTLTLSGTIASTGQGILVQGNGGGTIAFTGASKSLSTGVNHGVELVSNTGAAVQFAGGGLAVATTTGEAFRASGGGTVTVTGVGNTLTAVGGAALRVANTTIGAAGITFRSVAATGGANGIVLENTGSLNGMQVTGTGVAGSGGTIQGTSEDGVYLESTRSISLAWMEIRDNLANGIAGTSVSGFALDNASVLDNGDDASADEGGIRFYNLSGSASVSGTTVAGSVKDNVRVANTSGVLDRLTVSGSTFAANQLVTGEHGLHVSAAGTAVLNLTLDGNQFTASRTNQLRVSLAGAAQSDVLISGNTFANTHPAIAPGAGGVVLENTGGSPTLTYTVSGNAIRGALGSALVVHEGIGEGTFSGTISGNTIGLAGVTNSGSAQGSGISLIGLGAGTHTVAVTNNQVRQYNNYGVLLQIGDASFGGHGTLNATVTGNTIAEPGTAPFSKNGIHLNAGLTSGDDPQVCLDIGGAGALANSITGSGSGGAAGTDFRLRQRFLTTVRLPGYAGANNDNAAVTAFVQGRNGGSPTGLTQNTVSTGGGGYVGGAACPQP